MESEQRLNTKINALTLLLVPLVAIMLAMIINIPNQVGQAISTQLNQYNICIPN